MNGEGGSVLVLRHSWPRVFLSTYERELAELVFMLNPGPLWDRDCPNMMRGLCKESPLECRRARFSRCTQPIRRDDVLGWTRDCRREETPEFQLRICR